ncbi:MAG: Abi family protein [Verrucomicrobia bacterium]|jgi:abortive infection bacteriophage resistance protein|nr:Abi family protein [Verrucomicrobiota bacterium]MBT7068882.1 Abi family protein [Verrucomicrobiota bacterium]
MKYLKPALTFPDQADLLLSRGLAADRDTLIERLEAVNYYRLSAYWYTFRDANATDERLLPGTTLGTVWRRYTFDRQLRLLVMDAIERVEIAMRTQLVNRHTMAHGPFGHIDRANLPGMNAYVHQKFMDKIRQESDRSREDFVKHYVAKYTSETDLPLWVACELMTFGGMLTLFRHVQKPIKRDIAKEYGVADKVLESWLLTLNFVRNTCAHHARLWNRGMGNKQPAIPRAHKHPDWHQPVAVTADRMFGVLTVLYYLLKQAAPQSAWKERFKKLLTDYPDIPIRFMGFPDNWEESPLWDGGGGKKEGVA